MLSLALTVAAGRAAAADESPASGILRTPYASFQLTLIAAKPSDATAGVSRTMVSVVGFDDNVLAATTRPRLTSVRSPLDAQAVAVMELLEAQLRGEMLPAGPRTIPTRLSVRDSTAAPPA